jgi:hypothetical protein
MCVCIYVEGEVFLPLGPPFPLPYYQLTLYSTVVTICTNLFHVQKPSILPTQCIYVFPMILTINSDCLPKQH